ncbi:hypothetical protein E2542_SST27573 [Spatholobus suberectus]|nr:hypothetical protein E2542_SST27573 [Spatholobus suberectus]
MCKLFFSFDMYNSFSFDMYNPCRFTICLCDSQCVLHGSFTSTLGGSSPQRGYETGTNIFSRTSLPSRVYRVVVTGPYCCGVVRHAPTVSTNHQPRPRHRCTATAAGCRSLSHKPLPNPTAMMCDPPSTAMFPSRNLRILKFLSRGEGLCAP